MKSKLENIIKATIHGKRHEILNIIENFKSGEFNITGVDGGNYTDYVLELYVPFEKREFLEQVLIGFNSNK